MRYIFEGKDITNRNIHLSDERWHHIAEEHPEVTPYFVEFGDILKHPIKVVSYIEDPLVRYFYRYYKQRISAAKYLMLIVKYLNGTLIESGTIPSGGSKIIIITNPIVCSDATYTILDEDLNVLYTGSIVSGGDLQQTILNAVVQNSDLSYDTTVPAQGILPLPNVRIKKSDGISSIAVIPSVQNYNVADSVVSNTDLSYSANVMATDSLVLPDTTYNINLDGVLNQTFAIPTLKNETINISL